MAEVVQRVAVINVPDGWLPGQPLPQPDAVLPGHVAVVSTRQGDGPWQHWTTVDIAVDPHNVLSQPGLGEVQAAALWAPDPKD